MSFRTDLSQLWDLTATLGDLSKILSKKLGDLRTAPSNK